MPQALYHQNGIISSLVVNGLMVIDDDELGHPVFAIAPINA